MRKLARHVRFSINPFLEGCGEGYNSYASKPCGEGFSLYFGLWVELFGPVDAETTETPQAVEQVPAEVVGPVETDQSTIVVDLVDADAGVPAPDGQSVQAEVPELVMPGVETVEQFAAPEVGLPTDVSVSQTESLWPVPVMPGTPTTMELPPEIPMTVRADGQTVSYVTTQAVEVPVSGETGYPQQALVMPDIPTTVGELSTTTVKATEIVEMPAADVEEPIVAVAAEVADAEMIVEMTTDPADVQQITVEVAAANTVVV